MSEIITEDFKKCIDFHGHICPGLAIGYRVSKAALEELKGKKSLDEEIVSISETDGCFVDAIQVLTGCTAGKGNFIYRDYGKIVFTFFSRKTGIGVRFSLKSHILKNILNDILQKKEKGKIVKNFSLQKNKKFPEFYSLKVAEFLKMPFEEMFSVRAVNSTMPSEAKIEFSRECCICKEPVMSSKLRKKQGKEICTECWIKEKNNEEKLLGIT